MAGVRTERGAEPPRQEIESGYGRLLGLWPGHFIGGAVALLIGHGLVYLWALAWDVVDDAYISFRYARNLMEGHGLVFNIGERVEGYTNFLWTLVVAPFSALGISPRLAAVPMGLLFGSLTLWLVYGQGRGMGDCWAGVLAALFLAVDGSFAMWSVGGMETVMFTCLAFMGATAYLRELSDPGRWPQSGLMFGLAAMTRPEGVILFAMTVAHQVLVRLSDEDSPLQPSDLLRVLLFSGLWGTYFLGRWRYYGFLLPNTFYVKVDPGGPWEQLARGGRYLLRFSRIHLGHLVWLPLGVHLIRRGVDRRASYVLTTIGTYMAYVVYVGGDWSVGRFLVPLLPFLYLLAAQGLGDAYRWLQENIAARSALTTPFGLAALAILLAAMGLTSSLWGEYALYVRPFDAGTANRARVAMGKWLRQNVPGDTVIAVDAAGELAYYSELRTIDLFGLTEPAIAHMKVPDMGKGTPGHEKFGLGYVLARRPDYIIIYGRALDGVDPYQRVDLGWTEDPGLKSFLSTYQLRAQTP